MGLYVIASTAAAAASGFSPSPRANIGKRARDNYYTLPNLLAAILAVACDLLELLFYARLNRAWAELSYRAAGRPFIVDYAIGALLEERLVLAISAVAATHTFSHFQVYLMPEVLATRWRASSCRRPASIVARSRAPSSPRQHRGRDRDCFSMLLIEVNITLREEH